MNQNSTGFKDTISRVLLILGSIGYLVGIIIVGQISFKSPNAVTVKNEKGETVAGPDGNPIQTPAKPPEIPSALLGFITAIGTALAVHTGRELGIPSEKENEELDADISVVWERVKEIISVIWKKFSPENIPRIATVLYLVGLGIALFYFCLDRFSSASAEFLQNSWTSLAGLMAGIWSIKTE